MNMCFDGSSLIHIEMLTVTNGAESRVRSALKAISYRTAGTLLTTTMSLVMTGSAKTAMLLGCAEVTTKLVLYWAHERLWSRIHWGRHHVASASEKAGVALHDVFTVTPTPSSEQGHQAAPKAVTHARASAAARDQHAT